MFGIASTLLYASLRSDTVIFLCSAYRESTNAKYTPMPLPTRVKNPAGKLLASKHQKELIAHAQKHWATVSLLVVELGETITIVRVAT